MSDNLKIKAIVRNNPKLRIGFTGMNNSSAVMEFLFQNLESSAEYDTICVGYGKDFEIWEAVDFMAAQITGLSGRYQEIELWGYSLGAKIISLVLFKIGHKNPALLNNISVKLVAPYFEKENLLPNARRDLEIGYRVPRGLANFADLFGKKSDQKIAKLVQKDFDKLEDPAYSFDIYEEVCSKIYKERNLSKIIAEVRSMVGEVPILDEVPKSVEIFIARNDEFMDNMEQSSSAYRIFGSSVKIHAVDSTHCGFPFEKKWVEALAH